ncbi:hypothetical protein ACRRTK_013962 [Alexandromys fortis]
MGEGGARAAAPPPPPARAPLPVPLCRAALLVRRRQRRRSGPSPAWCRPRGGEPRRRPGRSRCQGAGRGAGLAAPRRPRSSAFSAASRAIRSAAPRGPGRPFRGSRAGSRRRGGRAAERPSHLPDATATLRAQTGWGPCPGGVPTPRLPREPGPPSLRRSLVPASPSPRRTTYFLPSR